jgi:hypothetical protein
MVNTRTVLVHIATHSVLKHTLMEHNAAARLAANVKAVMLVRLPRRMVRTHQQ